MLAYGTSRPLLEVSLEPFAAALVPVPKPIALAPQLPSSELGAELGAWTQRLPTGDATVALARSRLVSAMLRTNPRDGIVDAVVSLEALFRDPSRELRFRIAAAMAWLLRPDDGAAPRAV